jgi:glycosyltransferase involved in cell wall biosynthesis
MRFWKRLFTLVNPQPASSPTPASVCSKPIDLAVIISEYNRGWVLETICRQIEKHWPAAVEFVWTKRNRKITAAIPKARAYWFSHFQLLCTALDQHPHIRQAKLMVWYTHPSKPEITTTELVAALNKCHGVIFACDMHRQAMIQAGVRKGICHVVLGGADPEIFYPQAHAQREFIGMASAYYQRKNPQLIEAVVRSMPEEQFLLVGPKPDSMGKKDRMWTNYPGFQQLTALPNFHYVESDYADYPQHYNRMKIFLSLSTLEGGPISLIEALLCGCQLIATDTGFAADVIQDATVGAVLPVNASPDEVCASIKSLSKHRPPINALYTWENFTKRIFALSSESDCAAIGNPN